MPQLTDGAGVPQELYFQGNYVADAPYIFWVVGGLGSRVVFRLVPEHPLIVVPALVLEILVGRKEECRSNSGGDAR